MKPFFYSLLPAALFFAFIGCSDSGGSGGSGNNADVNVPSCGNTVDEILTCATDKLKADEWDEAVAYYNKAYENDRNNPKTIIYSTLANLAKISTDPKVVTLMKEHFGFETYPNKLNALLSDDWMSDYCDVAYGYYDESSKRWVYWEKAKWGDVDKDGYYFYDYSNGRFTYVLVSTQARCDSEKLPTIATPDWVKGKGSAYNDAMLSGNVLSVDNWSISLLANVLNKNSNGFNPLLDDVIEGVFGASFNLAAERLSKLENRKEERIKLDPYFIEELDLEDVFDEYDQVGWAEANAILSAMLLVKASLEWVQSYDLSTDLNWLKYSWKDDSDDIRNHFKSVSASKLPFNNNFFKVRPGKMANSKADYVKAVKGFQSSYSAIINSDLYPTKLRDSYATINGGFEELIKAINNGSKFYIPENPTKGTWPTSKSSKVEATIDFGQFFEEGHFSLQNIFETNGGKQPVFYLEEEECDYWDCDYIYTKLSKSNYAALIADGGWLALALKTGPFNAIIDKQDNGKLEYFSIGLNGEDAKTVFEKYYP
jgi:hypothetical protein